MTAPTFFAVEYAINPWMDPGAAVDSAIAIAQWEHLCAIYRQLGHVVDVVEPVSGLPDMVYAANGGLIINGKAIVARFRHPQRQRESIAYSQWMMSNGYPPFCTRHTNEGQGDLLPVGGTILAGSGSHRCEGARPISPRSSGCRSSVSNWSILVSITSTPR